MKRQLVTVAALIALAATALGAVRVTNTGRSAVCIPPAVVMAWT